MKVINSESTPNVKLLVCVQSVIVCVSKCEDASPCAKMTASMMSVCVPSALKTHMMNVTEVYQPLRELASAAIHKCVKKSK